MNKNNDVMICINDLYFEDTEDMRKLSEYVLQLERKKFFYEKGYRKVLMINELLKRKNKKLYTKCHVYKVELNRCRKKLTRIYAKVRDRCIEYDMFETDIKRTVNYWKDI